MHRPLHTTKIPATGDCVTYSYRWREIQGDVSIFGLEHQYGQVMPASAIEVGENDQGGDLDGVIREDRRKNVWRGIWVHLNLGVDLAIFARGAGR